MNNNIIIALDQGSSSSRAVAVSQTGQVLVKKSVPVTFTVEGKNCEYNALDLLNSQTEALAKVLEVLPKNANIISLAVCAQRSTIVLWDKLTGKPLCPALSWLDGRAQEIVDKNPLSQDEMHAKTGLYKTPYYSAPKIKWCIENYPEVKEALKQNRLLAGPVPTYLIWNFTQGKVFAADYTTAQRTLLFNLKTFTWDKDILKSFDIPASILPEIKPSFADYGFYKDIPITVCVGDQQAASAASGLMKKGDACMNFGTGAFMLLNIGAAYADIPGILTSVSWNSGQNKPDFVLEGPINTAGSLFTWLNSLGLDFNTADLDKLAASSKAPVWLFPALGGLGAPYWDFKLTPVMGGLKPTTVKEDFIAGTFRSLAFLMADIAFYIKESGFEINRMQASGGLSLNDSLLKFQSDILQTDIIRNQEPESTALGAAYIAAVNKGIDASDWHVFKNYEFFKPSIASGEAAALYAKWRAFFEWASKQPH